MASDLPSDPKEREILLRALREYSESCEPPGLTPDCPFSVPTAPGLMGCGEECIDLLARYNAPRQLEELDLGDGMSILRVRRPRARRVRERAAFDARQIYLEDNEAKPPEQWRLAAVLRGLEDLVMTPPPGDLDHATERRDRIRDLIGCAQQRGLDLETYVEPWLRQTIAGGVFTCLVAARSADDTADFELPSGWSLLARQHLQSDGAEDGHEFTGEALGSLLGSVYTWSMATPLDDLLDWVPAESRLFENSVDPPSLELTDDAAWIIDRFTMTYLDRWSTPALHLEWLYLHGQHSGPCPSSDMKTRAVDEMSLAKEIADRHAANSPPSQGLAARLVEPAVRFIEDGRRVEAAALFEAAAYHEPGSFRSLNNLGFCLLPDDPARALGLFEKAVATGHGDIEIAQVNRILTLALLGRFTSAIDSAEVYLSRHSSRRQEFTAWLWDIDSVLFEADPQLIDCSDSESYVESILQHVQDQVGAGAAEPPDRSWN